MNGTGKRMQAHHEPRSPGAASGLEKEAERLLLSKYVPAAVVVDDNLEILHTRGGVDRYFVLPAKRATPNLLKLVHPGLRSALQAAIRKARKEEIPVINQEIRTDRGRYTSMAKIEVVPLKQLNSKNPFRNFLILFEDSRGSLTRQQQKKPRSKNRSEQSRVGRLRQELAATNHYLQATIEENEASAEELQVANDELQVANQLLQSANEELWSTNEELRTTNEELQAVRNALESASENLNRSQDGAKRKDLQLARADNDIGNIPLVALGADLRVRRYTPPAAIVLGLTSMDIGRPIVELPTMENIPELEALLCEVISEGKSVQREIQDPRGASFRLRITPRRGPDNSPEGAVLTLMDITSLKRSLGELTEGQARLQETLQLMQNGLLVANVPCGKLQLGNDRLWQILGDNVKAENSVLDYAKYARDTDGTPLERDKWALSRSMRGEVVSGEEIEWCRNDGKYLFLGVSSAPIRDKAGGVVSVVATFVDLTYRRSAEDMLRVSEQMASTGRLAAALAHEINNPLEALTNLCYLLASDSAIDKQARKYVAMAKVEVDRVSHISRSLLGLYRSGSKTESFHIREVINDVLEVFASRIASSRIRVVKRYEAEGVMHGSYTEIRQVFLNLVGNALEAMDQNGLLTVRTSASRDWRTLNTRGFRISVTDNGSGIPHKLLQKVFQPFFTTKASKGTGLGLWVSNGIIHRYGGSIRVRSRTDPGRSGTCFSIFLPNSTVKRTAKVTGDSARN